MKMVIPRVSKNAKKTGRRRALKFLIWEPMAKIKALGAHWELLDVILKVA